ncbi:MAG: hypothetical protein RRY55_01180 [Bacteroidales bacterium]
MERLMDWLEMGCVLLAAILTVIVATVQTVLAVFYYPAVGWVPMVIMWGLAWLVCGMAANRLREYKEEGNTDDESKIKSDGKVD